MLFIPFIAPFLLFFSFLHLPLISQLLVSSADIFCKQFRTRSCPTWCWAWSVSKLFDLMVFLKEVFEKRLILKKQTKNKNSRRQNNMQNYPGGKWASPASLRCGPWARHIYPSLVLVQPRKTRPCLTERLLMALKESNQTNNQTKPRRQRVQHTYFALSLLGNDLTVLPRYG